MRKIIRFILILLFWILRLVIFPVMLPICMVIGLIDLIVIIVFNLNEYANNSDYRDYSMDFTMFMFYGFVCLNFKKAEEYV